MTSVFHKEILVHSLSKDNNARVLEAILAESWDTGDVIVVVFVVVMKT